MCWLFANSIHARQLQYRTRMCRFRHSSSLCPYGQFCTYAHSERELCIESDNVWRAYRAKWEYLFACGYVQFEEE